MGYKFMIKKFPRLRFIMSDHVHKLQRGCPSTTPQPVVGSGSSKRRIRDKDGGSTSDTLTSGDHSENFVPCQKDAKRAKLRPKGKAHAREAVKALERFNESLRLNNEIRQKGNSLELEILRQKEARKWKQMEIAERNMQMQVFRMKWEMLQSLLAKENLDALEEKFLIGLRQYFQNFKGVLQRGCPSTTPQSVVGSGSSEKRVGNEDGGSTPNTPTSGDLSEDFMPRQRDVKKGNLRLKGKAHARGTVEALERFSESLRLCSDMREKENALEPERLEMLRQKEAKKKKQMEISERNMQMRWYQMNWKMPQSLLAKEDVDALEEQVPHCIYFSCDLTVKI